MFDALLDQAQLDAGTRAMHLEPVPLAALFAQIESQFSHQTETRGLWLRCRPTAGVVMADRLALWRIASNLVTNALEATAQGGVLVAWRAHRRTLEVRDSGRGIAIEDHETVFEEFRRLPEASRNARGLGLGLATVRRLAHLMGATVTLRSAPGRGSVFSLCFPAEAVTAAPAAGIWIPQSDPAPRISVRALPGTRVLAVDDDLAILAAIEALLGQWGFEVRVAADCVAAEAQVGGGWTPSLMVFDRRLPDGDGAAMAAALRGLIRPAPACLIITGDTAPDDLLALRGSGFDVLHKPVSPAQLLKALESLGMLAVSPKDPATPQARA
jgi:CheY-like chemotaxis protein/anti-sigma regulatory factor (Ser/Thr protein kinase)